MTSGKAGLAEPTDLQGAWAKIDAPIMNERRQITAELSHVHDNLGERGEKVGQSESGRINEELATIFSPYFLLDR